MPDENDPQGAGQEEHPIDKRIKKALSDRDEADAKRAEAELAKEKADQAKIEEEQKRVAAEKERDFFKNFNTQIAKYPQAAEFQDKIKEKVIGGYELEDATVAVLNREGKFTTSPPPPKAKENPAGGSAATTLKGDKSIAEMTQEERRQAIRDAETRGDITIS